MIDKAIHKINPNAQFKIINNDLDNIKWINGTTPISKADIEAKIAELPTAEEEATALANLKANAKTKLMNGEALTEDEANVMVGL